MRGSGGGATDALLPRGPNSFITVRNSSCGKVMFSQASVILFTEGVSVPVLGYTPSGQISPWQTLPLPGQTPPGQTPPGRHPMDRHPQADTPWVDNPPGRPLLSWSFCKLISLQNNMLAYPLWELATPLKKILDPSLVQYNSDDSMCNYKQ